MSDKLIELARQLHGRTIRKLCIGMSEDTIREAWDQAMSNHSGNPKQAVEEARQIRDLVFAAYGIELPREPLAPDEVPPEGGFVYDNDGDRWYNHGRDVWTSHPRLGPGGGVCLQQLIDDFGPIYSTPAPNICNSCLQVIEY
jgi:hypothetical protein